MTKSLLMNLVCYSDYLMDCWRCCAPQYCYCLCLNCYYCCLGVRAQILSKHTISATKKITKKSYKNNKHPYKYILYLSQRKKKNVLSVNIYLLQTCSNTLLLSSFSKSEVDPIPGDFCEQENNKFLGKGVCPALSHGLLFCSIAADANKFL